MEVRRTNNQLVQVRRRREAQHALPTWATDHKNLAEGDFWRKIPGYRSVSPKDFNDHRWQLRNTITKPRELFEALGAQVPDCFYTDVAAGFEMAPMSMRVTPYLVSLIDWSGPYDDPLRRQFVPVASQMAEDHPCLALDSLNEQSDSPTDGLTHRYMDRALLLALDTCPVYCRFCTRSYAVGANTASLEKRGYKARASRWEEAFDYVATRPELEDIVVSGGDVYLLRPEQLEYVGGRLLDLDNIKRIRFATKGPAVMPQKILSDDEWVTALINVVEHGRRLHKEVALHTHFNHPSEATAVTKRAMDRLFELGIRVRNQSVLQREVNDHPETMRLLVKRLSYLNVQPYYVYLHDMVKGVDDLRTTLQAAVELEKITRGVTAGFNTPTFVCDAPGGGGKRDVHSYEFYDRETGVSVFTAPAVKSGLFLYFDPIGLLDPAVREAWKTPESAKRMIENAIAQARNRGGR